MALAHTASDRYWLGRYLEGDSLLALTMLAVTQDHCPECRELGVLLTRINALVDVHLARLVGADVVPEGSGYRIVPPGGTRA